MEIKLHVSFCVILLTIPYFIVYGNMKRNNRKILYKITWVVTCFIVFALVKVTEGFYTPEENIKNCKKPEGTVVRTIPEKRVPKDHVIKSHEEYGKENYTNNINCGWILEADVSNNSARFTINIVEFDLEESKNCDAFDYMRIYQQADNGFWDLTQNYKCGYQMPTSYKIWAKKIYIEFQTDSSVTRRGFLVTYNIEFVHDAPKVISLEGDGGSLENGNKAKVIVYQESHITFKCNAVGNPSPSFEWEKRNKNGDVIDIDSSSKKIGTPKNVLTLENVKLSDAGYYGCSVRNKHVESSEQIKEFIKLTVYEKCRCPKTINAVWYPYYPYAQYNDGFDIEDKPKLKGIIYQIAAAMLQEVCGNCEKGHGQSNIMWNGATNRKKNLQDVKRDILNGNFDIALPILHHNALNYYYGYKFLHILRAPGFQYLKKPMTNGGEKIFAALFGVYPICLITVVMIGLAGIVIWMLDTYWNEEELPRSVLKGLLHGSWWAYITMTTVGYGDKAPKGVPGRIFAVVWIMGGLVIISILTGAISTALTIASMKTLDLVQSKKLAAINLTEEYLFGVKRGANMTGFDDFKKIADRILNPDDELFGVLVDVYVAGYYKELHKLEKNSIISLDDMSYGIVFGKTLNDSGLQERFQQYLDKKHFFIDLVVAENTSPVSDIDSFELVDPKSPMFITSVLSLLGMLLLFSLAGLGFEYGYMKPRQQKILEAKNLEMIESKSVKKLARSEQIMKDSLVEVMEQFYEDWNKRISKILKKQDRERQDFEADQADYIFDQKRKHAMEMETQKQLANAQQNEIEMQRKNRAYDSSQQPSKIETKPEDTSVHVDINESPSNAHESNETYSETEEGEIDENLTAENDDISKNEQDHDENPQPNENELQAVESTENEQQKIDSSPENSEKDDDVRSNNTNIENNQSTV